MISIVVAVDSIVAVAAVWTVRFLSCFNFDPFETIAPVVFVALRPRASYFSPSPLMLHLDPAGGSAEELVCAQTVRSSQ